MSGFPGHQADESFPEVFIQQAANESFYVSEPDEQQWDKIIRCSLWEQEKFSLLSVSTEPFGTVPGPFSADQDSANWQSKAL